MKTNFLTTDLLIADIVVSITPELEKLMAKYNMQRGGKIKLNENDNAAFASAIKGLPVQIYPGGSSSNTSRTLAKLLDGKFSAKFIGVMAKGGTYSPMIQDEFEESGVELLIDHNFQSKEHPITAVSYIIKYPDGERSAATYPGNSREFITPDLFPEELIAEQDIILLQGSTRAKFNPEVIDHILAKRWKHEKQLILAAPTSAFQPDYFEWVTPSANIFLSNADELEYIFKKGDTKRNLAELQKLQSAWGHILTDKGFAPQVAMITDGKNGAYIVTASEEILHLPTHNLGDKKIVNTLGAGDTSFSGFIVGKILGLTNKQSGQLAMALAATKLLYDSPTIPDPLAGLQEVAPRLAKIVQEKIAKLGAETQIS